MPRPIYRGFSMDPPHVDPSNVTNTGSGQNFGCPEINAWLSP